MRFSSKAMMMMMERRRALFALLLPVCVTPLSAPPAADPPSHVNIRFTNTVQGPDKFIEAPYGANLLLSGDKVGVKIPRACRNGLCGTCVCDVIEENGERRTIRACTVSVNADCVIDVWRTKKEDTMAKSMSRFDDGWEDSFVPDYKKPAEERSFFEPRVDPIGKVYDDEDQELAPWERFPLKESYTYGNPEPEPEDDKPDPLAYDPNAPPWERIW